MSKLYCGAVNCGNNRGRLCALAEIAVRGADAASSAGTCCASFVDGAGIFSSAFGEVHADPETQIACTAQGCLRPGAERADGGRLRPPRKRHLLPKLPAGTPGLNVRARIPITERARAH